MAVDPGQREDAGVGSVSAMADMSRAIRLQLERHGPTVASIPTEVLREYASIVGAFAADLRDELEKREVTS